MHFSLGSPPLDAIPSTNGNWQEQKLFDLGTSVADVSRSLSPKASSRLSQSAVDPRQLLWGILTTLSRIRGSQSHLLPVLLERSSGVLGMAGGGPLATSSFLLDPPADTTPTGNTPRPWDKVEQQQPPQQQQQQGQQESHQWELDPDLDLDIDLNTVDVGLNLADEHGPNNTATVATNPVETNNNNGNEADLPPPSNAVHMVADHVPFRNIHQPTDFPPFRWKEQPAH